MAKLPRPAPGGSLLSWCTAAWEHIRRSRVKAGPGLLLRETSDGVVLSVARRRATRTPETRLQFAIYIDGGDISAAPGVLGAAAIGTTTEVEPADGTWYLQAKVALDTATGAITARAVEWHSTEQSSSSPNFYRTIGTIVVADGSPTTTIIQNDWGPIVALPYGAAGDIWQVELF